VLRQAQHDGTIAARAPRLAAGRDRSSFESLRMTRRVQDDTTSSG